MNKHTLLTQNDKLLILLVGFVSYLIPTTSSFLQIIPYYGNVPSELTFLPLKVLISFKKINQNGMYPMNLSVSTAFSLIPRVFRAIPINSPSG